MSVDIKKNVPHSVFQRLLNRARAANEDVNFLLSRYGMERFLYRLSISSYADRFVLKGASLFLVWKGRSYRVTRDADFQATGTLEIAQLKEVFVKVCNEQCAEDDGMIYLRESVQAVEIRENHLHDGARITLLGLLHQARIPIQIDIGFGDVITPAAERIEYPVLLDGPAPTLQAYPRYTVVSEKLESMVKLGIANSRMKDYYDILLLSRMFAFEGNILRLAIRSTFERRRTPLPEGAPFFLTAPFYRDAQKQTQWKAFVRKTKPTETTGELQDVIAELEAFLLPIMDRIQDSAEVELVWSSDRCWEAK